MKKIPCTLLALALIFALASCGEKPDAPAPETPSESEPPTESVTPSESEPPTEETEHVHTWIDATCTEPKTCSECGATEGEALGHDMLPATTEAPATCSRCGYTEGEPMKVVASGVCGENLTWTLTNTGLLTISGTGPMYDYDPFVAFAPWYSDPMPYIEKVVIDDGVTSIGSYSFVNCNSLTAVTIPDSVTLIGEWAFNCCVSLTDIALPDSLTSIGNSAFSQCTRLTDITIPKSVTAIGNEVFTGCFALKSITVESGNEHFVSVDSVLFSADMTVLLLYPNLRFGSEYIIPSGVTEIGNNSFAGCEGLTSVTIPDSVTRIGNSAFMVCTGLTSITIPGGVTTIGDLAFASCSSLREITIPASVTAIGAYIFERSDSLTDIYFGGTERQWASLTINSEIPSTVTVHYGA